MSAHNLLHQMAIAPFIAPDPGDGKTISATRWGMIVPVKTGAAETRTLAVPTREGLQVTIGLDVDGGDLTLTVTSGYNAAATTTIVFDDAGDWVTFQSVKIGSVYRWRVVAQEGTNATITNLTATAGTVGTLTATALKLAVTALNASGSNQANGIANSALSAGLNVVGAADNTTVVALPPASAGLTVLVQSTAVNKSLPVYPQVNQAIDNLANNAAVTLAAAVATTSGMFVATNAAHWVSLPAANPT